MYRRLICPSLVIQFLCALTVLTVQAQEVAQPAPDSSAAPVWSPEQLAFFETKIRPVLIQQCYTCHSAGAKVVKGGLLLDSRAAMLQGGDSGPALVPGNGTDSLLMSAIRHESFEMPPKGKLPAKVIADFAAWIEMGAPDPRVPASTAMQRESIDVEAGRQFWSFQPLQVAPPPDVKQQTWPRDDIDRFVLHKLESAGVAPSPPADSLTLLRRITFDLTGLPPALEDQQAFSDSASLQGLEPLVDRLLNSPQFGERWGRYWLDSARFSESTGGGRSMIYGPAWRYRDYVIDSLNHDKPFDRFLIEQIAGDLMISSDRQERAEQITATAFLALGPTNLEEQDKGLLDMDIADEQIDTIGRVFMGMTLGCARCHDHKFDPIPTRDYYALAGIFRSTHTVTHSNVSNWLLLPLPLARDAEVRLRAHIEQVAEVNAQLNQLNTRNRELRQRLPEIVVDDDQAQFKGNWTLSTHTKGFVGTHYRHAKGAYNEAAFSIPVKPGDYEVLVSYTPGTNRSRKAKVEVAAVNGKREITFDQTLPPPERSQYTSLGDFTFGDSALVKYSTDGVDGVVIVDSVLLRSRSIRDENSADNAAAQELDKLAREIDSLKQRLQELEKSKPLPDQTLAVEDEQEVRNEQICLRGNTKQRGETVPRGFLSVASWEGQPTIDASTSGRLQLGYWLADPRHPLTARVYVNRVWSRLFGQGIVRTVDNFGQPGERPSHPQLLDSLADRFMRDGWSTKRLVREIVLSQTYQQSSAMREDLRQVDPENRLLARQNRRRLDAEAIHDALLSVSGELDLQMGGDTIAPDTKSEYGYEFQPGRRAIYLPVFRNQLPDVFSVFDFANPNQSTGQRVTSTLSTQALFLMNSPFILQRSALAAQRIQRLATEDSQRIELLFQLAVGRPPTSSERELALAHLSLNSNPASSPDQLWQELCQSLFGSVDFRYLP